MDKNLTGMASGEKAMRQWGNTGRTQTVNGRITRGSAST